MLMSSPRECNDLFKPLHCPRARSFRQHFMQRGEYHHVSNRTHPKQETASGAFKLLPDPWPVSQSYHDRPWRLHGAPDQRFAPASLGPGVRRVSQSFLYAFARNRTQDGEEQDHCPEPKGSRISTSALSEP